MYLTRDTLLVMSESAKKPLVIFTYFVLVLSTLLVFWQVGNFDFINYDDDCYVYENPHVLSGLTPDSITWAFTTCYYGYWQPLTWLSLMMDCQLFGPAPGWFHLVSLFLHLASTLLLFAVLKKMTGSLWPSAFVAAAFALHPMHVESVAWISERKDVLSTFFLMLTLAAYVGYVKRPSVFRYLITLAFFVIGLLAKPMLVTLPFLLLLLDYWPLNRLDSHGHKHDGRKILYRMLIEKIPFFILAVVSGIITFLTQQAGAVIIDVKAIPMKDRIANVFFSYATYMGKMFWPQGLTLHYPLSAISTITPGRFVLCVLLLAGVSFLAIRFWRTRKYLLVGWFWFVGMLLPVIGFVQFTWTPYADRFTYIPYIGLFIMVAWGLPELLAKWTQRKIALGISMIIVLTTLGMCSHRQVSYWSDSFTLFSHAVEVTQDNYVAYNDLGLACDDRGRSTEAIECFSKAISIMPDFAEAHMNLGNVYGKLGRSAEAIDAYQQAIKFRPDYAEARYDLANEFRSQGRYDEAAGQYSAALSFKPDWPDCMNNLALLISIYPQIKNRDTNEAVSLASRACQLTNYKDPVFLCTLAAAYASAGRFSEAVDTANKALYLADVTNQSQIRNAIQYHLSFYKQGKPYIEPSSKPLPDSNKP
jgi:Flp pilus assembly protein TadD